MENETTTNEANIESPNALAVSPEGLELSAVLAEIDRPAALQSSDGRPDDGDVSASKVAFCVSDRGSAEWVLRLIAGAESELALVKEQAAVLIKRLENNVGALHFHFDAQLESWAKLEIARQGGRVKSLQTMYGQLGFRSQQGRYVLRDEQAALDTARTLFPETVKEVTTTSVQFDKDAYLDKAEAYARENGGDVLAGADWQPPKETFGISRPKPRKNAGLDAALTKSDKE